MLDAWDAIMADPQLAKVRRKLSIHEIRMIILHAKKDLAPVRAAAKALVEKIDVIHADRAYESVFTVAQLHVGPYAGPTYVEELAALRAALGDVAQQ